MAWLLRLGLVVEMRNANAEDARRRETFGWTLAGGGWRSVDRLPSDQQNTELGPLPPVEQTNFHVTT